MSRRYRFNLLELAGSLGDLGTFLPIAIGMVLINDLDPLGLFLSIGLFYILSGVYFGVTMPVQPMKVIGAYAIATGLSAHEVLASGALVGVALLIIGGTGAITVIGKYTPKPVVRGVQLSTGALLMAQGVRFMVGSTNLQHLREAAEPYLSVQSVGPIPIGIVIGVVGGVLALLLLENKRFPAGLIIVLGGLGLGLILGTHEGFDRLRFGIHLPKILPFGLPHQADYAFALFALALPQLPMTLGNAVIAMADLSREYFGEDSRKVTYRGLCISMSVANFLSFLFGGMPLCHGAGGLAAHYRFGARTAGANLIIGTVFLVLAILIGTHVLGIVHLIPMSILGVLLLLAGSQLALTVADITMRKDLFVVLMMLGIALASNLAVAFIVGLALAYALKCEKLKV
jgi:SulP family sulfate permease